MAIVPLPFLLSDGDIKMCFCSLYKDSCIISMGANDSQLQQTGRIIPHSLNVKV